MGKNLKIYFHFVKENCNRIKKRCKKDTKTNKNQIKPKQVKNKISIKTASEYKKTKQKSLSIKQRKVDKQESASPICKRVWKKIEINWNVCRIFTMCEYEALQAPHVDSTLKRRGHGLFRVA